MKNTIFAALSLIASSAPVWAEPSPVVVELFTSQGCSSCPPAEEMMAEFRDHADLLPLSFHVDYWDYIGWKDTFASPEFTARQHAYAAAANDTKVYTPQFVINGKTRIAGARPMQVMEAINALRDHTSADMMVLSDDDRTISLMPVEGFSGPYAVQIVSYEPSKTTQVQRGENAGKELTEYFIVTRVEPITVWDGQAVHSFTIGDNQFSAPAVVLLQQGEAGPIHSALRIVE